MSNQYFLPVTSHIITLIPLSNLNIVPMALSKKGYNAASCAPLRSYSLRPFTCLKGKALDETRAHHYHCLFRKPSLYSESVLERSLCFTMEIQHSSDRGRPILLFPRFSSAGGGRHIKDSAIKYQTQLKHELSLMRWYEYISLIYIQVTAESCPKA